MKRIAGIMGIGCVLSMLPVLVWAQQRKDTLEVLRTFVQVCQAYKQAPLQMSLEYRVSTNYIMNEADTDTVEGTFYNTSAGAYIRFGEMEQIVNDTVALVISERMKKMILFSNAKPILAAMKSRMGMPLPDSSISNLAEKYAVTFRETRNGIGRIELISKATLGGSHWPKEGIVLEYHVQSKEPVQVVMKKNSLMPVAAEDSALLVQTAGTSGHLIEIPDNGRFFVREQESLFLFKKIEHNAQAPLPVQVTDRIVKNEEGRYTPASGYESFSIKQN